MPAEQEMESAIEISGVSKRYKINYVTPADNVATDTVPYTAKEFWALKDINLTIKRGEVVGLIGQNGAGKSTLLKLLGGIAKPTCGSIKIKGRVSSMLELGTGFNPELTGKENLFMSGALAGYSKTHMQHLLPQIIAQSGVAKFIDTPVKYYSSGMYVRLAFSLISHLGSDVLLLDEIHAVGDASFRDRSFDVLHKLIRDGRAVLLASHNPQDIQHLCTRVVWLHQGSVVQDGLPQTVLEAYLTTSLQTGLQSRTEQDIHQRSTEHTSSSTGTAPSNNFFEQTGDSALPNNEAVEIISLAIGVPGKPAQAPFYIEDDLEITVVYKKKSTAKTLDIVLALCNVTGSYVFSDSPVFRFKDFEHQMPPGTYTARCTIPGQWLNRGTYYLNISACENMRQVVLEWNKAAFIKIVQNTALVKSKAMQEVYDMNEQNNALLKPHLKWELYNEQNQVVL